MSKKLEYKDLYVTVSETVSYTIRLSKLIRPGVLQEKLDEESSYGLSDVLEEAWCELPSAEPYCEGTDERTLRVYSDGDGATQLDDTDLEEILECATDYQKQDEGGVV